MSDELALPLENDAPDVAVLLRDLRQLITSARERAAVAVNRELTLLYWHLGNRILREILQSQRANYGALIVPTLSAQLTVEYGKSYSPRLLFYIIQFAEVFSDLKIVQSLTGQLGWSHFKELLPIKDRLKREFYTEMCRLEKWSVRTMRGKIDGMLYRAYRAVGQE